VDQAKKLIPVFDESERSPETSLMGKKGEEIVPYPKPTKLRGSDERKIVAQGAAAGFLVGKSEGLREEEDDWDTVPDPKATKLRDIAMKEKELPKVLLLASLLVNSWLE
jgi:hypothetical protein